MSQLPLQVATWKKFRLDALFDIRKGKRLTKANYLPGDIPYVGASDKNNGVTARIGNTEHLNPAGCVTVSYDGSVGEAFVQPEEFWASDAVNVLYPLEGVDIPLEGKLFICALIRTERYRFNYGRKWHLKRMEKDEIRLPVTSADSPDWDWVVKYVQALPTLDLDGAREPVDARPAPTLNVRDWKEFRLEQLFDLKKGKRLTKANYTEGNIPYVGASDRNNGITTRIGNSEHLHPSGCITVSYNGSVGEAFVQPEKFWATDDVNVLYPKGGEDIPLEGKLFICALIRAERYRFNYGRKWHLKRMEKDKIRLPVTTAGDRPDWTWMEHYIKSLPYSSSI